MIEPNQDATEDLNNCDFPAAHSMDSGWFAIDEDGNLAHFDTGEAGALPDDVTHLTGDSARASEDLWFEMVLPWVARNTDPDEFLTFDGDLWALFESEETAAKAGGGGRISDAIERPATEE